MGLYTTFASPPRERLQFQDLLVMNRKVYKVLPVSRNLFPEIRRRLNDYNCNRRVLFPGIDGFAAYFQNHTY